MISFKLKHIVLQHRDLLSIGSYKVLKTEKVLIFLNDGAVLQFIEKNYQNFSKRRRSKSGEIFDLFFKFEIVDAPNSDYSGQLLMLTKDRDIKIFDFNNSQVLTLYKDPEKISQIRHAFAMLSPFFDHTLIRYSREGYQIEELINQRQYNELSDVEKNHVFKTLVRQYIRYFSTLDCAVFPVVTADKLCRQLKVEIPERVFQCFEKFLLESKFKSISWKRVFLHGDLNGSNILLHGEKIKLIDFERAKSYVFIYDIFNYIYVEQVSGGNCFFLRSYYNGEYDVLLRDLFAQFDLSYDGDMKTEYMLLFLAERLLEKGFSRRWVNNEVLLFLREIEKLHDERKSCLQTNATRINKKVLF